MSRLQKNIIYNAVGQTLVMLFGFVAVKYIFTSLGEDALGIIYFTLIMNAVLFAVCNMGICSTTVREVSGHHETDPGYVVRLIQTFSLFYWGAYLLLSVGIYLSANLLVDNWINLQTMERETAILILRILGIASMAGMLRSFYASLLTGLQRMGYTNLIDVSTNALQQLGCVIILALGGDLFQVVYWFSASYYLRIIAYMVVCARFFTGRALVPAYFPEVIRRNLRYASRMMFISATGAFLTQMDKLVVSKLLPLGILGYYSVAYSSFSKASLLTEAIAQAAFPSFTAHHKAGDRGRLLVQYERVHDLICLGMALVFAFIPFVTQPLFTFLFNAEIARLMFWPAVFLSIGFYMNSTVTIPYYFTLAMGRPEITARKHFYDLFITFPATILLVVQLGLVGASLSIIVFYLFSYIYWVPRACSACFPFSAWTWYRHVGRIYFLVCATYVVGVALVRQMDLTSIVGTVGAYAGCSLLYMAGAYLIMSDTLKTLLRDALRKVTRKGAGGQ